MLEATSEDKYFANSLHGELRMGLRGGDESVSQEVEVYNMNKEITADNVEHLDGEGSNTVKDGDVANFPTGRARIRAIAGYV